MIAFDPPIRLDQSLGQPWVPDEPVKQKEPGNSQQAHDNGND
jgi:hypothetical protein